MTIVELLVHMDCAGCETKIKKALQKLPGVDDVNIDIGMQKVSVMGWADQKKILKTVRKIGKKAELWPYPYNPQYQYHGFTSSQYNNYQNINYNYNYKNPSSSSSFNSYTAISMKPSSSSYNYYVHGYNNGDHFGYYQKTVGSTIINDKAISIFSDDNPHACSIM